jgi:molybdopterin synthase catalytic subunit
MRVRVLFFGILKDITGKSTDEFEPGGAAPSVGGVFDHYAGEYPRLREMASSIVLARNREFAAAAAPVEDGDEIAFLPPVSGGAGPWTHEIEDPEGHFFALTRGRIDSAAIAARLLRGEDGAVVNFEGVVRNNTKGRRTLYLDYECYEAMAIETMAAIGREIASAHAIGRIAMVHRLGRIEIGEASVAVIAAAPHRRPAFDAALEGINRLKRTVPIWKKEYFEDGEVWVEGEWDDRAPVRARS